MASFFPTALENLIDKFAMLPGIGKKSAQRLAFFVLGLPEGEAESFADAIIQARGTVHTCKVCQNLTDAEVCPICSSDKRDKAVICVVAEPRDVVSIERGREYNGVYHVLHGVLSPLSHIGPDDLKISELVNRVAAGGVEEVIMALNPDTEGETTSMYVSRLLKPFGVKVTPTTPPCSAPWRAGWRCDGHAGRHGRTGLWSLSLCTAVIMSIAVDIETYI